MNTNDSNPCFPFNPGEGDAASPFNFAEASLSAVLNRLRIVETIEESTSLVITMDRQEGMFSIVRSLSLNLIDQKRLYLEENCTSIYDFCARQRGNVFAVSRGTAQNSLVFAETLYELSGYAYRDSIHTYLEHEGRAEGRGFPSDDGTRLEFRLVDFAGHVSKLDLLRKLMDKVESDIDWHEFFTDGYDEYAAYVYAILHPEKKEQEQAAEAAISHLNSPYRPGGSPPNEESEPQAEGEPSKPLDPFAKAANGPTTTPDEVIDMKRITHHFDRLDFNKIPSGTLAGHPVFDETDLYADSGFADRALALMRKELV